MSDIAGEILAIELGLGEGNAGHAFFGEFFDFAQSGGAVNWPLGSFAFVDLLGFFGEARADIFEVFFDVMMHAQEHLFEFLCGRRRCRRRGGLFYLGRRSGRLLFLYMDGAGMGQLFDFGAAASGARNEFLVGLFLEVFKAWKPAFEVVLLLTEEIVNDHKD